MGFWEFMWVLIVTCIVVFLIGWGMRTNRYRVAGFAIALGAFLWAWLRPDSGGWFLFRPLGGPGWMLIMFILLVASLVVGFFLWRLAKLIGWIAVFIAVFAPFWDLFTAELWGDLLPWNWSSDLFSGSLIALLVTVGVILLVLGFFFRFLWILAALALLLALILWAMNLVGASPDKIGDVPPRGEDKSIDMCLTVDGKDDGGAFQKFDDIYVDPEGDGSCYTEEPDSTVEGPVAGPEFTCSPRLVQRELSDAEDRSIIRRGIEASTTEKSLAKWGRALLHQAHDLRQMAVTFRVPEVPPLRELLTDNGKCLSVEGIELHDDLMNRLGGMLQPQFGFAPLDGHNSWIDRHGHLVISKRQFLAGDRKSLVFIDGEGRERHILVRCGNPVYHTHR